MTSYIYDGDTTPPRSSSNAPATSESMTLSSSTLALTGHFTPMTYTNFADLKTRVASRSEGLAGDSNSQYLSFKHVSLAEFHMIETMRHELGSAVRFTYFPDIQTLIIKVVTIEHEQAHRNMGQLLDRRMAEMRVPLEEFQCSGAARYVGPTASSKECDSSWRNNIIRPRNWPFLVIEAGVSESMPRLRADADWWFSNSGGRVKLVLLIKVTKATREILVEKCIPVEVTAPSTRARTRTATWKSQKVKTIKLRHDVTPPAIIVTPNTSGAPLVLEFERVIGRPPVRIRGEHDIAFSSADLLAWSRLVFNR